MATETGAPRWLEYRRVEDLPEHPDNPSDHDLPELVASMRRFGFTTPPMLCERTGLLAEGHGRKKATLWLRDNPDPRDQGPPPGVTVDLDGNWLAPVVRGWSSANDTELRAYLLAGNYRGGWHNDMLADLLVGLAEQEGGLVGTGVDPEGLDTLLAELGRGELPQQDTDAEHAALTARGDPADPRQVQGLNEVGLMFVEKQHAEFMASVFRLRQKWPEQSTPLIVLRALRHCAALP
jgi:hypothetical protein